MDMVYSPDGTDVKPPNTYFLLQSKADAEEAGGAGVSR